MHIRRMPFAALLAALLMTVGLTGLGTWSPRAEAAVPATIPLTFTNNSGRDEPVYLYDLGTEHATGRQGWADAGGTFHPWPSGGNPPTPAPDASIPGPANGRSVTIRIPKFSGRVYFSYGRKLDFRLTTGAWSSPRCRTPPTPTGTSSSTGPSTR